MPGRTRRSAAPGNHTPSQRQQQEGLDYLRAFQLVAWKIEPPGRWIDPQPPLRSSRRCRRGRLQGGGRTQHRNADLFYPLMRKGLDLQIMVCVHVRADLYPRSSSGADFPSADSTPRPGDKKFIRADLFRTIAGPRTPPVSPLRALTMHTTSCNIEFYVKP